MSTVTEIQQTLIEPAVFAGKIFIDGEWVVGGGGEIASLEPATGATLAMVGIADAADVARAAEGAASAQKEWAALPHPARAAVLRKAGHAEGCRRVLRRGVRPGRICRVVLDR
jgi:benzaldehyde dehydrogenase (NAD)